MQEGGSTLIEGGGKGRGLGIARRFKYIEGGGKGRGLGIARRWKYTHRRRRERKGV